MATGRTISASFLTDFDKEVIELCSIISDTIYNSIKDSELQKLYKKEYGKISLTRDGGLGLGGGKLQRDCICTRGRQGKAPYSNRNLRWHPLIVGANPVSFAKEIERIEIEGDDERQILNFVIKNAKGQEEIYPSDKAHELPERFVALPRHWFPHINTLKSWSDTQWTQNSCVIPAYECCEWFNTVESYVVLGIAVAVDFYRAEFNSLFQDIQNILKNQIIDKSLKLPTYQFPKEKLEFILCPICMKRISENLNQFRNEIRPLTWQPAWRSSKKEEGDDASNQIMHVNPLIETEIRHTAKNVRYGHRWCNVAMTDHSLDETLDFMEFVVKTHNRCK
ncbi:MAG TPA: hypothetical protein PKY56_02880 [Candidatus Kapabacteria bacterium]|nr:hypothetical protein [Candidatus Kapabacteria bacterium]